MRGINSVVVSGLGDGRDRDYGIGREGERWTALHLPDSNSDSYRKVKDSRPTWRPIDQLMVT